MTTRVNLRDPDAARQIGDRLRAIGAAVSGGGGVPGGGDPSAGNGDEGLLIVAALAAERELKLELSHPGTGRIYDTYFFFANTDVGPKLRKIGERAKPHRASAPGEPPAVDTGELRASVTHLVSDGVAYAGTPLNYGRFLEYGFVNATGTMVEPRPWMRPVVERLKEILPGELAPVARQVVSIAIHGGGR